MFSWTATIAKYIKRSGVKATKASSAYRIQLVRLYSTNTEVAKLSPAPAKLGRWTATIAIYIKASGVKAIQASSAYITTTCQAVQH